MEDDGSIRRSAPIPIHVQPPAASSSSGEHGAAASAVPQRLSQLREVERSLSEPEQPRSLSPALESMQQDRMRRLDALTRDPSSPPMRHE